MGIVNRIVVGEGMSLVRAAGLREDAVLEVVAASSGNSWQVENWFAMQEVAQRSTTGPGGMAAMARKDLRLALEFAAAQGLQLPLGSPEEFAALIAAESKRWGEVIRTGGIKLESN